MATLTCQNLLDSYLEVFVALSVYFFIFNFINQHSTDFMKFFSFSVFIISGYRINLPKNILQKCYYRSALDTIVISQPAAPYLFFYFIYILLSIVMEYCSYLAARQYIANTKLYHTLACFYKHVTLSISYYIFTQKVLYYFLFICSFSIF